MYRKSKDLILQNQVKIKEKIKQNFSDAKISQCHTENSF